MSGLLAGPDPIKCLSLTFDLPLQPRQVAQWRGAFVEMAGLEEDILHNHQPGKEKYFYRYPLVQYRSMRGKAGLFALAGGVDSLQTVLSAGSWRIRWEDRETPLQMDSLRMSEFFPVMLEEPQTLRLRNYLPFNDAKYAEWQTTAGLLARVALFEKLLTGHLLAFASGLNWRIPDRGLQAVVLDIERTFSLPLHGVSRPAFDLLFQTNIKLPFGVGLGKGVSHGFGTVSAFFR